MKSSIQQVIHLLNNKRFDEAKNILEDMARSDPNNPEILYNLGMCYSELGDLNASIETLNQSLNYKPDSPNTLTALSFSYIKVGRLNEAEQTLLRALELDPNNLYAINNLGGLYGKMEKYDLAIKTLEHGEELFPDDPRIIYGLGISHQKLGNLTKADAYFRKLVKRYISDEYTELAKTGLRGIAEEEFKRRGLRPDAVMYCLSALQRFSKMSNAEIKKISFEIALKGRSGLDTNDPSPKYQLISLSGNFSGLNLVCYMYVGFKIIALGQDIGFDLSKEYEAAKNIHDQPELITWN
jgi:tetratricopeptide (TPR) repeat protein